MESLKGYKRPEITSLTQSHSDENTAIFTSLYIFENSNCGQFRASRV